MNERDIDVGRAIRKRREQLGWTQQLAAERVGMSVEGYARIERGARMPGVDTFVRICRGLGASPNDLLGWPVVVPAGDTGELEPLRQDVLNKVNELDEAGLQTVRHVATFAWDRRK